MNPSMFRRADRAGFDRCPCAAATIRLAVSSTICSDSIRKWVLRPVIRRRDVPHAIGVRRKLVALFETGARGSSGL